MLAAPLVGFGLITLAWVIDRPDGTSETVRNVVLAGRDVGQMNRAELAKVVADLDETLPTTPIRIVTKSFTLETTAGALGIKIDRDATVAAAMETGRGDHGPAAPARWFKSLFTQRAIPVSLDVDRAKADATIIALEGDRRTVPVEPTLSATKDGVKAVPGSTGRALDIVAILDQLPSGLDVVGRGIEIRSEPVATPPKLADATIEALASQANDATGSPLAVTFGESKLDIDATELRSGFSLDTTGAEPKLALDEKRVAEVLNAAIKPPANPTRVTFDIVNGVPTPKAGADAVVCCGPKAPAQIVGALLGGKKQVSVDSRTMTAAEGVEWASGLGVKEVIGEFTTKHPCCAPRVSNIHRISDMTRGVLIAPGETFSANGFVGKRTKEKGFASAPVIENGKFSEDYGGGVSQWATTTFNAAFFAGLDIPDHKAHSIYISRYPYGREATLAYPSVDLKIHNNTPYGVVIWPTYTGTSITVQLWSTRFVTGEQTGVKSSQSGCGSVTVTRKRTFVDGKTDTDTFKASYDCDPPEH